MSIPRESSPSTNPLSSQNNNMEETHPTSCSLQTSANTMDSAEKDFSKYKTESIKLSDGPPACYQLKLDRVNLDKKSDEESKLRKFTLRKRDPKYPNKTILLVGETGSGKSTLINALVNFVMGVKFEDKVWFEIIADEKVKPQTESQTSEVSVYEIFGFEGKIVPYSLTIIDTPGYGDTKGVEFDQITINKLLDLFCVPDEVNTIDAVGLVVKASQNRLDERIAYIFNSITSLFGKDMEKNIVALITHSDGRESKNALQALENANIKYAKNKDNEPVYFNFNNSQKVTIGKEKNATKYAAQAFEIAEDGMSDFTHFLDECQSQSLEETRNVLNERKRLTACIENFRERVTHIEIQQEAIQENKKELINLKEEISNLNSRFNTTEAYKDREACDNTTLSCQKCKETCKSNVGFLWLLWFFWHGNCTVCSGQCPRSDHVREKWRYVTKTRKIEVSIEEMHKMYEAQAESKEKKTLMDHLKEDMEKLLSAKRKCLDDAFEAIEKLEKIALNADSVSTYVHLDFLIEKMEEKGDTEKVRKLRDIKHKIEQTSKGGANYFKRCLQKIWSST